MLQQVLTQFNPPRRCSRLVYVPPARLLVRGDPPGHVGMACQSQLVGTRERLTLV